MSRNQKDRSNRTNVKTYRTIIGGHQIDLTANQILADKKGWIPCHGEIDDTKVRSLSIKEIGDKTMIRNGNGALVGVYDTDEFKVMCATAMRTNTAEISLPEA